MKRIILFTGTLLFTTCLFAQEVKKIKITDLEDHIRNSDHPLVVSFWATWCGPCVEEIPWFQETVAKYADQKVELVLVSLDFKKDFPASLQAFIKKKGFKATFYWLDETNADYFCPKINERWSGGIPSTLMVNNKTGYRRFFDRALTDRQVEPEIKTLLKESASPR
jgi:thiol-disulfide isomerase/thioredoxin